MTRRFRRAVALLVLPFFLVWSVLLPRQAYAFAPVGAPAIAIVGTLAGGAVMPIVVGVAISGLAYLAFKDLISDDEVRVPARDGAAGAVPAPTAPSTVPPLSNSCVYSGPTGNVSASAWISAQNTAQQAGGPNCYRYTYLSENVGTCTLTYRYANDNPISAGCDGSTNQTLNKAGSVATLCPAGYTVSGTSCVLSNARAVVDDKKQDYTRSSGAFSPVAGDLAGNLSGTTMTTTTANDTVAVSGKDSDGNPLQGKIIAKSGGGTKVELKTQKIASSGQTYVETKSIETNANGDVTSSNQVAAAGNLTYDPAAKIYTEQAAPAGALSPLSSGSGGTGGEVIFPSDYARQGEAASAANTINAQLGPKIDAITQTGADPVDPTVPGSTEWDAMFFNGTFNTLLGWQLPAHTSQCPTSSFNWNSNTYTVDTHCQLVTNHFSVLQSAMSVVWTVLALFIILGA